MDLRQRIRDMNTLKGYLKKYSDCVPYESKEKLISLIQDIDNELNWFKFQKLKRDMRNNNKQISLF